MYLTLLIYYIYLVVPSSPRELLVLLPKIFPPTFFFLLVFSFLFSFILFFTPIAMFFHIDYIFDGFFPKLYYLIELCQVWFSSRWLGTLSDKNHANE